MTLLQDTTKALERAREHFAAIVANSTDDQVAALAFAAQAFSVEASRENTRRRTLLQRRAQGQRIHTELSQAINQAWVALSTSGESNWRFRRRFSGGTAVVGGVTAGKSVDIRWANRMKTYNFDASGRKDGRFKAGSVARKFMIKTMPDISRAMGWEVSEVNNTSLV